MRGPGPAAREAQGRLAGVEGQSGGGVQQPVAQRLGSDGQLVVEREVLGPGDEVLGDQRELEPVTQQPPRAGGTAAQPFGISTSPNGPG